MQYVWVGAHFYRLGEYFSDPIMKMSFLNTLIGSILFHQGMYYNQKKKTKNKNKIFASNLNGREGESSKIQIPYAYKNCRSK